MSSPLDRQRPLSSSPPARSPRRRRRVVLSADLVAQYTETIAQAGSWSQVRALLDSTGWDPALGEAAVRWSGHFWLTQGIRDHVHPIGVDVAFGTARIWQQQPALRTVAPWPQVARLWDVGFRGDPAFDALPVRSLATQVDPRLLLRLRLPDIDAAWLIAAWKWATAARASVTYVGWERHLLTHPAASEELWALAAEPVSAMPSLRRNLMLRLMLPAHAGRSSDGISLSAERRCIFRLNTQSGQPLRPYVPLSRARILGSPLLRAVVLDPSEETGRSQGDQLLLDLALLHVLPGLAGEDLVTAIGRLGPSLLRWSVPGLVSDSMLRGVGRSRVPTLADVATAVRPSQLWAARDQLAPLWRTWIGSPERALREFAIQMLGRQVTVGATSPAPPRTAPTR